MNSKTFQTLISTLPQQAKSEHSLPHLNIWSRMRRLLYYVCRSGPMSIIHLLIGYFLEMNKGPLLLKHNAVLVRQWLYVVVVFFEKIKIVESQVFCYPMVFHKFQTIHSFKTPFALGPEYNSVGRQKFLSKYYPTQFASLIKPLVTLYTIHWESRGCRTALFSN